MHDQPFSLSPAQEPAAAAAVPSHPHVGPDAQAGAPPVVDEDIHPTGATPRFPSVAESEQAFYTREGEELDAMRVAAPFQFSGAIPLPPGAPPEVLQATGTVTASKPSPKVQRPWWWHPCSWGRSLGWPPHPDPCRRPWRLVQRLW